MNHFAFAFMAVGVVASMAYCTVEESRQRKEERLFHAEFCEKQGGRWTDDGWGRLYCDFAVKS